LPKCSLCEGWRILGMPSLPACLPYPCPDHPYPIEDQIGAIAYVGKVLQRQLLASPHSR